MPEAFFAKMTEDVLRETEACVLLTQPLPEGLSNNHPDRIVNLGDWCKASADHYLALVAAANMIISVDSLAMQPWLYKYRES